MYVIRRPSIWLYFVIYFLTFFVFRSILIKGKKEPFKGGLASKRKLVTEICNVRRQTLSTHRGVVRVLPGGVRKAKKLHSSSHVQPSYVRKI